MQVRGEQLTAKLRKKRMREKKNATILVICLTAIFPMKSKNFQINKFNLVVIRLSRVTHRPYFVSHLFRFVVFI